VKSRFFLQTAFPIVLLIGWTLVARLAWVTPIFLPSPLDALESLQDFAEKGWLGSAIVHSYGRILIALASVSAVAIPLGILVGAFSWLNNATRLVIEGAKTIPISGLLGLIVLWFGIDDQAKIVFLMLGSFFYLLSLVRNAIASVEPEWVEIAQQNGASRWQVIVTVLIPASLPQIWQAICINHGIMWTYVVLAEFINSSQENIGLGYLIYISARTQRTAGVFGAMFLIVALASFADYLFVVFGRRFLFPWKPEISDDQFEY
jgi:ABC-type nitrate/sulfonate/bicarbonate transport system permease component